MTVEADTAGEILKTLLTDEVNTNATFYVAEITGDHPKYGLDREFVTGKRSPYSLDLSDLTVGDVYEVKADDQGLRVWFQWGGIDTDEDAGDPKLRILDRDNADVEAVLDVVESDVDPDSFDLETANEMESLRRSILDHVDEAVENGDVEHLRAVDAMLDTGASRDPGELTVADLGAVPDDAREAATLMRESFGAAYERHTDTAPPALLQAIVLDGALLAERQQRSA